MKRKKTNKIIKGGGIRVGTCVCANVQVSAIM